MKLRCLVTALFYCASNTSHRPYYPEENLPDHKRYHILENSQNFFNYEITVFAQETDMTYYLYTNENADVPRVYTSRFQACSTYNFNPTRRTFFLIHGWGADRTADFNVLVRDALLSNYDVNIIVVDWSPIASQSYWTAQSSVVSIGAFVASFVQSVIDAYCLNPSTITLVGYSLGAHIAGNAGSVLNGQIGHIIGLDPVAFFFSVANTNNRLDPSDAQYVQVIHTNGRLIGFSSSIGHADFYPNGGMIQAGCGIDLLGVCSHERAFKYLAEAIRGARFTATLCGSYFNFIANRCVNNQKTLMGLVDLDTRIAGDFFLDTRSSEPFALS